MIVGGDDYYAELDYIEVMENAKEGYEEEVENIEEENSKLSVEGSAIGSMKEFYVGGGGGGYIHIYGDFTSVLCDYVW